MVTWGIISAAMALVSGVWSFYTLRFLWASPRPEFFPGIILYLTYLVPSGISRAFLAAFAIAVPVSTVIGAPISGLLLGLDGAMGLKGWQWLFIIEGVPSVLLGIVTWFYLTDRPAKANWLTGEQKACCPQGWKMRSRRSRRLRILHARPGVGFAKGTDVSLIYFGFVGALYGIAVLAAADRQGVRLFQRADRFSSPRSPICSAPLR